MIDLSFPHDADRPLHTQLRAHMAQRIRSGEIPAGTRLPTVRELAVRSGLNRNTVQKVYAGLRRMGLVATRIGDGTYVRALAERSDAAVASPLRERMAVLVQEGLSLGASPAELEAAFASILRETSRCRDTRQTQLVESRRRVAANPPYRYLDKL